MSKLSVVVPTLGRLDELSLLLKCLSLSDPKPHEILVVDGDPAGAGADVIERWQAKQPALPVEYLQSPPNVSHQRNVGIERASGDVLVFFDDDVFFGTALFAQIDKAFEDPAVVGITGRVIEPRATRRRVVAHHSRLRRWIPGGGRQGTFTRFGYPRYIYDLEETRAVRFMPGCFMCARRDAAASVRFDEQLTLAEDEDFSYRLSQLGRLEHRPEIVLLPPEARLRLARLEELRCATRVVAPVHLREELRTDASGPCTVRTAARRARRAPSGERRLRRRARSLGGQPRKAASRSRAGRAEVLPPTATQIEPRVPDRAGASATGRRCRGTTVLGSGCPPRLAPLTKSGGARPCCPGAGRETRTTCRVGRSRRRRRCAHDAPERNGGDHRTCCGTTATRARASRPWLSYRRSLPTPAFLRSDRLCGSAPQRDAALRRRAPNRAQELETLGVAHVDAPSARERSCCARTVDRRGDATRQPRGRFGVARRTAMGSCSCRTEGEPARSFTGSTRARFLP